MSKIIRRVASIALPIVGAVVGNAIVPGIGGAIGGTLGGAAGGAMNGGGVPGAILGAVGGYASAGAVNGIVGSTAGSTLASTTGNAALQGATQGSGILGAATGGGLRALSAGASAAASGIGGVNSALTGVSTIGNQLLAQDQAEAATKATNQQSQAVDRATALQQPYADAGAGALKQINTINADPSGYIQNNPLYNSLADEAQRRLLANQAAKGKVGSGGTAAALQDQLLQIGNGLVQQDVGNLRQTAAMGQSATNNQSGLATDRGAVQAAGAVGGANAATSGYQNQINTLLALYNLNRAPTYQPTPALSR